MQREIISACQYNRPHVKIPTRTSTCPSYHFGVLREAVVDLGWGKRGGRPGTQYVDSAARSLLSLCKLAMSGMLYSQIIKFCGLNPQT